MLKPEDIQAAAADHTAELQGVPISVADACARFCIYASMLKQAYGFDDTVLNALIVMAGEAKLEYVPINDKNGN